MRASRRCGPWNNSPTRTGTTSALSRPGPEAIDDHVEICHGSPFDEDHYIFDGEDALRALATSARQLCLFGHTHLPVVFHQQGEAFDGFVPEPDKITALTLQSSQRYLINVGSVGQPRDGDPRAAYGLYDSESLELTLKRIVYPVDGAQQRIINAGLPASLANRLAVGTLTGEFTRDQEIKSSEKPHGFSIKDSS